MPHNTPNKPVNKPIRPKNSILLAVTITAAVTLGISAGISQYMLKNSTLALQNMTATNLAAEGIRAVRLLRDFNNLKFQGNRECVRMLPLKKAGDICNAQNSLVEGFYEIKQIPLTAGYTFTYLGETEDQSFKPVSFIADTALQDGKESSKTGAFPSTLITGTSDKGRFSRSIHIQFDYSKAMTVTSTVKWTDSGQTQQFSLSTLIANFYPNAPYEKK